MIPMMRVSFRMVFVDLFWGKEGGGDGFFNMTIEIFNPQCIRLKIALEPLLLLSYFVLPEILSDQSTGYHVQMTCTILNRNNPDLHRLEYHKKEEVNVHKH